MPLTYMCMSNIDVVTSATISTCINIYDSNVPGQDARHQAAQNLYYTVLMALKFGLRMLP